jgi:aryl carrier-like protein
VEKWRALGSETDFVQLAETPTISGWHRLLSQP